MHVEATATADLMVTRMNADPRTGRFDISFELPGSAMSRRLPLRFTGTAREMIEVATLTRPLRAGRDHQGLRRDHRAPPEGRSRHRRASSPEQAIGMAAARADARRPGACARNDLMKPIVVQRNEPVTIVYEVPGILLTVRGKALEAGAVGDIINVINVQSNRTVQATVIGPGRVTIAAATPRRRGRQHLRLRRPNAPASPSECEPHAFASRVIRVSFVSRRSSRSLGRGLLDASTAWPRSASRRR